MNAKISQQEIRRMTSKLKRFRGKLKTEVAKELGQTAYDAVAVAKVKAPVNDGFLRANIRPKKRKGGLNWSIRSEANYSAYQEFGTGRKVNLTWLKDAGFPASYAAQFRGRGIKQVNIAPQPFFFPAINQEWPKLKKRVDKLFKEHGRKF